MHNVHLGGSNEDVLYEADRRSHISCKMSTLEEVVKRADGITLVQLNISSLSAHYEAFKATVEVLGNPPIVGFCKTWLRPVSESFYFMMSYSSYANSR